MSESNINLEVTLDPEIVTFIERITHQLNMQAVSATRLDYDHAMAVAGLNVVSIINSTGEIPTQDEVHLLQLEQLEAAFEAGRVPLFRVSLAAPVISISISEIIKARVENPGQVYETNDPIDLKVSKLGTELFGPFSDNGIEYSLKVARLTNPDRADNAEKNALELAHAAIGTLSFPIRWFNRLNVMRMAVGEAPLVIPEVKVSWWRQFTRRKP